MSKLILPHSLPELRPVLRLDKNPSLQGYELRADCACHFGTRTFRVPAGFHYDGASIPSSCWWIVGTPFEPDLMVASLFHDWLYHTHTDAAGAPILRADADALLYEAMRLHGVGRIRARRIWGAVRLGGRGHWPNDAPDRIYLIQLHQDIAKSGRNPADYGLFLPPP